jgi:heat shock protein HtpX
MAGTSTPVLVYNRIDANRRNTCLLLPAFAVLVVPLAYGLTELLVPISFYRAYVTLRDRDQALLTLASIEVHTLKMVLLALGLAACIAFLAYFVSTYFVLRLAGGQRVDRREEPALWRLVENLCLGAGLPQPALYVVESSTPNAFSTGRDPRHASLVVTRGLLEVLDERELSGVLAHELSHIGNRDTNLSNLLAALVATMRLPLAALRELVNFGSEPDALAFVIMGCAIVLGVAIFPTFFMWMFIATARADSFALREVFTLAAPVYAFFIGPSAATWVRKIILHQREFLADADAVLLTRDPEGLALALAKIGAATGSFTSANVALAHLYFVDPRGSARSWFDGVSSHPTVEARIALLARMGDGIPDERLRQAVAAGSEHQLGRVPPQESRKYDPGARLRLADARTVLYYSAEGSSAVVADLDSNVLVTVIDQEAPFIRVRLVDGTAGYIPASARLIPATYNEPDTIAIGVHYRIQPPAPFDGRVVPGTQFHLSDRMTPLYRKPDGWSDVASELKAGTVVTFREVVGNFVRVEVDRTDGYIPRAAGAARISPERSHL